MNKNPLANGTPLAPFGTLVLTPPPPPPPPTGINSLTTTPPVKPNDVQRP